jgi:hypothetical protein
MTETTFSMSRPARLPRLSASESPWSWPTIATWLTILQSWPDPGAPISAQTRA